ncbi:hypothetical protein FHS95_002050 [Sphingomonas naasensis]|uniref:DUF3325 domain-containing protein n=1 Tax=Sphingomonas naasensis TaxID=1344951 RepID=A0A4S1WQY9_9SPHN|nr:DUF3325 domain-containing protein [Sphingomonas naasensis]NIJ20358.1 hypothetical protein [Sphingomonas naasensis]TGX44470.1 DUF3325 domain-containing protein [Sphingomonas naasensis]
MIFGGLLYLGLFALAASMGRHAQLLPAHWGLAKRAARLRLAAWLLILASLVIALWSPDWALRLLSWIGLVAVAGGIVLLSLTYGVRWARSAALLAIALVVAGLVGP